MSIINNFMTRPLIVRKPREGSLPVISGIGGRPLGDVVIAPGAAGEVDFWDAVKNHPVYRNLLDRKLITVGPDAPEAVEPFTSAGDTLAAPERLNPEAMKEEATAEGVKNLAYENEPKIAAKRRSRKSKAEGGDEGGDA